MNNLIKKYNISEIDLYKLGLIESKKKSSDWVKKEKLKALILKILKPYKVKFMDLGRLGTEIKNGNFEAKFSDKFSKEEKIEIEKMIEENSYVSKGDKKKWVIASLIFFGICFYLFIPKNNDNSESNFEPGQTFSFAGYPNGCNSENGCMYFWYVDFKETTATFYTKKDGDNYKYCVRDVAYKFNAEQQTIEFTQVLDDPDKMSKAAVWEREIFEWTGDCLQGVLGKWDYRFSDPETSSMPIVKVREMGLITYDGFYKSSDKSIDSPRFSKK